MNSIYSQIMAEFENPDMTSLKWLSEARWAPSGGNLQPWEVYLNSIDHKFNLKLKIRNEVTFQPTFTDSIGAGALMGLGAFYENISLLAPRFGFKIETHPATEILTSAKSSTFFDYQLHFDLKAPMSPKFPDPDRILIPIRKRNTHRWPMSRSPLTNKEFDDIQRVFHEVTDRNDQFKLHRLTENRSKIIYEMRELSFIRMTNKQLFIDLMNEIYDESRYPHRSEGLPISTLGLSPLATSAIQWIQKIKWHPKSKWMHGPSVKESIDLPLNECGEILYIEGLNDNPESWINLGRAYQRISLWATEKNYACHPFAYNLLIYNDHRKQILPKGDPLITFGFHSSKEREIFEQINQFNKSQLQIDFTKPGFLFRLGQPLRPSIGSPRRPLNLQFIEPETASGPHSTAV